MEGIFNKIRNLDAYPKINEDFYSRTLSGGVITLVSSLVMILLFFSELRIFSIPLYFSDFFCLICSCLHSVNSCCFKFYA